jgi:2-polyprenyl-3-methyl-5-hydroxy-6-metoxy-1,4-benzoquinol methylase
MSPAATLDALLDELNGVTEQRVYNERMNHPVPDLPVVDRAAYILGAAKGRVVLDIGAAAGEMHTGLVAVAKTVYAMDKTIMTAANYIYADLDQCHERPLAPITGLELIVCGEVLEHLSNPGHFLDRLGEAYPGVPVLFTVPNAMSHKSQAGAHKGIENVNRDHVAYYSYWTLRWLLERHGFTVGAGGWYEGQPRTAEGLILGAQKG